MAISNVLDSDYIRVKSVLGVNRTGFKRILDITSSYYTPTLDIHTSSLVAYSCVRRLRADYTGPLVRLISGSTEQDFYSTGDGLLDEQAILAWGGKAIIKVAKLYNQSGTGSNLDWPAISSAQAPWIASASAIYKVNGRPAMRFPFGISTCGLSYTTPSLQTTWWNLTNQSSSHAQVVYVDKSKTTLQLLGYRSSGANEYFLAVQSGSTNILHSRNIGTTSTTAGGLGVTVYRFRFNSSSIEKHMDFTRGGLFQRIARDRQFVVSITRPSFDSFGTFGFGAYAGAEFKGYLQEYIFWKFSNSGSNKVINDQINTFFKAY